MGTIAMLDDSFVSDVLIETLKNEKIACYTSGDLKKRLGNKGINLIGEKKAKEMLSSGTCKAYTNSEHFLSFISTNSDCSELIESIQLFKNKYLFRKYTENLCPGLFYKQIKSTQMNSVVLPKGKDLILKPSIGFLSLGIKDLSLSNPNETLNQAMKEILKYNKTFSPDVLNDSYFLIEEKIMGKEYACDAYFDQNGQPVVLGIYYHPFRDTKDVRDLVYLTGKKILKQTLKPVNEFLLALSSKAKFKNLPIHFEFRVSNGKIIPIEVNPLRFGGFGLADLTYYSFNLNPYEYFFKNKKPNWDNILEKCTDSYYGFVLGRMESIVIPNIKKFKQTASIINNFIEINYEKFPIFCIMYVESFDLNELLKYLYFDFSEYNTSKNMTTSSLVP